MAALLPPLVFSRGFFAFSAMAANAISCARVRALTGPEIVSERAKLGGLARTAAEHPVALKMASRSAAIKVPSQGIGPTFPWRGACKGGLASPPADMMAG